MKAASRSEEQSRKPKRGGRKQNQSEESTAGTKQIGVCGSDDRAERGSLKLSTGERG